MSKKKKKHGQKLKIRKSYIPLVIQFDKHESLTVKLDVREKGLYRRVRKLEEYKSDYIELAEQMDDISTSNEKFLDAMAEGQLPARMAEILKKGVVLFTSEADYDAILEGICDGADEADPEDVNMTMLMVFLEIEALVIDFFNGSANVLNSYADRLNHYRQASQTEQAPSWESQVVKTTAARDTVEVVDAQPVTYAE